MSTFTRARQRRLYEDVAQQLREAILGGEYGPGDRLPNELDLASGFGVSRAVVRQATLDLERQGLVRVQVGAAGGTFVCEPGIEAVIHAFENLFRHGGVKLEAYLTAKRLLEPVITNAVAQSVTGPQLQLLAENVERSWVDLAAGAGDDHMLSISLEFHSLLAECASNPILEAVMLVVVAMADRVPAFRTPENTDWKRVLSEHEELLEALKAHKLRRFSSLMSQHLDSVAGIYGSPG